MWRAEDPKSRIKHFNSGQFFEALTDTTDIWFLVFYNNTSHDDFDNWYKIKEVAEKTHEYCKIGAVSITDPMNVDWVKSLGITNTLQIFVIGQKNPTKHIFNNLDKETDWILTQFRYVLWDEQGP